MTIYAGAVAPEAIALDITTGESGLDLSTVSAATMHVLHEDGTTAVWACTVSNATPTSCRVTHAFQVGDVTKREKIVVVPYLTVPGGTQRCERYTTTVEDEFGRKT